MRTNSQPNDSRHGHRQRLRDRLLQANGAVADYELLEMLLFAASPRGATKPLAKTLLKKFGSFAAVLNAEQSDLLALEGVSRATVASLKVVLESAKRLTREEALSAPLLNSTEKLVDFCRVHLAYKKVEEFHLLFLDTKNRLIHHEVQQRGTVDQTAVYVREVLASALRFAASGLILVHNHPSGDPKPSRADISLTREIVMACAPLKISVHDHLIVGRSGHISLRSQGLMDDGVEL